MNDGGPGERAPLTDTLRAYESVAGAEGRARLKVALERLWSQSHDTGTVTMRLADPHTIETIAVGWEGHHPLPCLVHSEVVVDRWR